MRVWVLALAMCGAITRLSRVKSRLVVGMGSGSVTSNPAPLITPSFNAWYNAAGSMIGPRAVLTRIAVGFIIWNCAVPII